MRSSLSFLCVACVFVAVTYAAPATLDTAESSAIEPQNDREVIEIINLSNFGQSERDKRDINMLRQLFPGLAQIVDNIIQEITRQVFRVVGRAVLSQGLGGGGDSSSSENGTGRGRVSVSLPTFPPDEDDEEEEDSTPDTASSSTTTKTTTLAASEDEDNSLSGAESQNAEVRVKFDDQDTAASGGNGPSPADESADDADADRNKRFLSFGGGGDGHAAGGSGNFLFDIIRLVAGSGATEHGDAAANAPAVDADVGKGADGYTEGIPGPITRLFVIANRGIANLIQDLILRLAQTSERIVNFKARLVTALI